ncbi:MAG: sterol carrier family protein [Propionibacteriaceae bacterium]|nr:sterol carrier family protein [Propionibacteriaceae bacterium]
MRNVDPTIAAKVRTAARRLAEEHPGKAVELRIPPYTAVQLGAEVGGGTHRRGTPPTVVEMDADTFLALVEHRLDWAQAKASFAVTASGAHADLSHVFHPRADAVTTPEGNASTPRR